MAKTEEESKDYCLQVHEGWGTPALTREVIHPVWCQTVDGEVGGVSVGIGARVGFLAQANEVLVSQTVKDLVADSRLNFEHPGSTSLKGAPGRLRRFRVTS